MSAKDHFAGRLMADPEVSAFKLGSRDISIKYSDGTTLTIRAIKDNYEDIVLEYDMTEQNWDWERGAK